MEAGVDVVGVDISSEMMAQLVPSSAARTSARVGARRRDVVAAGRRIVQGGAYRARLSPRRFIEATANEIRRVLARAGAPHQSGRDRGDYSLWRTATSSGGSCLKSAGSLAASVLGWQTKRVLLESGARIEMVTVANDGDQHVDEELERIRVRASPGRGDTGDKLLDALPEFEDWMRAEFQRAVD